MLAGEWSALRVLGYDNRSRAPVEGRIAAGYGLWTDSWCSGFTGNSEMNEVKGNGAVRTPRLRPLSSFLPPVPTEQFIKERESRVAVSKVDDENDRKK